MTRAKLFLSAVLAAGLPVLALASPCPDETTSLRETRAQLSSAKQAWAQQPTHTKQETAEYQAWIRQMEDAVVQLEARLTRCLQNELYRRNKESIDDQAQQFTDRIQRSGENQMKIVDAWASYQDAQASVYLLEADYLRRTQAQAEDMTRRYQSRLAPPPPAPPPGADDAAIENLKERASDQVEWAESALHDKGAMSHGDMHDTRRGTDDALTARAAPASRSPDIAQDNQDAPTVAPPERAPSASAAAEAPQPGVDAPKDPAEISSDCPEDMHYLKARIRTPEMRSAPLISISETIAAAGGLERAILLTRGQLDADKEAVEVHRANTNLRASFPKEYRQYEKLTEDAIMLNQAYLEALECRLRGVKS